MNLRFCLYMFKNNKEQKPYCFTFADVLGLQQICI
jgi:hypothetical protein